MAEARTIGPSSIQAEPPASFPWRRLRRPLFRLALVAADFAAPAAAFAIAYTLRYGAVPYAPSLGEELGRPATQFALLVVTVAHVLMLRQAGLYLLHRPWLPLDIVMRLVLVCVVSTMLLSAVGRGAGGTAASRILLLYFGLVLVAYMFAAKLGARIVVLLMLCFGIGVKKVVLVGQTQTAHQLLRTFRLHPQLGYRVIGLAYRGAETSPFEDAQGVRSRTGAAPQVLRGLLDLRPDLVIIADSARKNDEMLHLIAECTAQRIEVRLVPEFSEVYASKLLLDRVGAITMVHLRMLGIPAASAVVKRLMDLLMTLPLLPVLGLAVLVLRPRARGRGVPVLVKKARVGLRGRRFGLYAFHDELDRKRSGPDSPGEGGEATEPRQSFLRATLPQALNVIKGDMSVVGPRAGDPERAAHYNSWEKRMLAVRPGVLGFGAVNAVMDKDALAGQLDWDVGYLDQQCAAFDLNHIFMAVVQGLFGHRRGAGRAG